MEAAKHANDARSLPIECELCIQDASTNPAHRLCRHTGICFHLVLFTLLHELRNNGSQVCFEFCGHGICAVSQLLRKFTKRIDQAAVRLRYQPSVRNLAHCPPIGGILLRNDLLLDLTRFCLHVAKHRLVLGIELFRDLINLVLNFR